MAAPVACLPCPWGPNAICVPATSSPPQPGDDARRINPAIIVVGTAATIRTVILRGRLAYTGLCLGFRRSVHYLYLSTHYRYV